MIVVTAKDEHSQAHGTDAKKNRVNHDRALSEEGNTLLRVPISPTMATKSRKLLRICYQNRRADMLHDVRNPMRGNGGRGIRTPGTVPRTAVFKTAGFNRSPIPPFLRILPKTEGIPGIGS